MDRLGSSLGFIAPAAVLVGAYILLSGDHDHGHEHVAYPYMRVRDKPFPWGKGDCGLWEIQCHKDGLTSPSFFRCYLCVLLYNGSGESGYVRVFLVPLTYFLHFFLRCNFLRFCALLALSGVSRESYASAAAGKPTGHGHH